MRVFSMGSECRAWGQASSRHPCHRPARDQDVERHHQAQVGAAPDIVRMHPGRHVDASFGPDHADAEVQVPVVGAEDEFGFALMAGGEDWFVRFSGLEAEGADESVAQPEERVGPTGKSEAPGGGLTRGEGGGDRVAVEEVSGLVERPERGGVGEGVSADVGHVERIDPGRVAGNEASGRGP